MRNKIENIWIIKAKKQHKRDKANFNWKEYDDENFYALFLNHKITKDTEAAYTLMEGCPVV